jgi:hypothetical protein
MSKKPGDTLLDLLYDPTPDVNRIIDTFISLFNAVYGNPAAVRWDISKEDWQRYEFLGDRVLNLIIAQSLFSRRETLLDEGEMTCMLASVVSNRALDTLSAGTTRRYFPGSSRNRSGSRRPMASGLAAGRSRRSSAPCIARSGSTT